MGVEADLRKVSDEERDVILDAVARYKADRHIWHKGCSAASEMIDKANRRFENPLWNGGYTLAGAMLRRVGIGLPSLYTQTGLAIAIDAV